MTALTRPVSLSFADCELETLDRQRIDVDKAIAQHAGYERCLAELGARVVRLPAAPELPDAVFVEDLAVVVDEVALMTRMRSATRRREAGSVASALSEYRPLRSIREPATVEGGDVLRAGSRLFIGLSSRTNEDGIAQIAGELQPLGYSIQPVPVNGCMHLKTGCCLLGGDTLLVNRAWVDTAALDAWRILDVPEEEPFAANVISLGGTVLIPACFPATCDLVSKAGWQVMTVDISELMKAEAGLTCMSLLFDMTYIRSP